MKFSVDPWDPSYGASVDTELLRSGVEVRVDVERPADEWAPVAPDPAAREPEAVLFVDGVRRTDAQVWVDDDGHVTPALCASYAAGVVCCCPDGGAHLLGPQVRRGLFAAAGSGADIVTGAGTYRFSHVTPRAGVDPGQVLSQAVQVAMGAVELDVAAAARAEHGVTGDLLVVDGPLRGRTHLPRAVGFVKTHTTSYLPPELDAVVAALPAGYRTPVFGLGDPGGELLRRRLTWYLRLPCPPGSPWAGIARVECSAEVPVTEAVALASQSQATLVRYASVAYKDSRAPQNLYPIAGLERALRRRLGEPALLYRALRRAAAA